MYRSPRGSFGKEADAASAVTAYAAQAAHFILPVIALIVLIRCIASMFYGRAEPETWGHLVTPDGKVYPLLHWECLIGRARSADITLPYPDVANVHAVLMRNDAGEWTVSDLSRSGGVYLNGEQITEPTQVFSGDILRCSTHMLKFADMSEERRAVQEQRRTIAGRKVSAGGTLFFLTVFQLLLALEFVSSADSAHLLGILMSFAALALTQWFCYVLMRTMDRSGFEVETIAFFLCTLGLEICATSTPDDLTKEIILIIVGIALFFLLGWWLRDLDRVKKTRWLAAAAALGLLALNLVMGEVRGGSMNWLEIGGFTIQPSELVKVCYIYAGAATLDRLFARRNLFGYIVFSAVCVCALALMGDFGTAVIFFATFLVVSFMRSGSFATVLLAVSGAGLAGFLVLSVKPYIAQRFATWGHAWEDVWDAGFQQTRAMSAAASGGLFGQGAGEGWLKDIVAANTDMVFAVLSEELGLIVAVIRTAHDQQRVDRRKNPLLGLLNGICQIYTTVIRGTPMLVQLFIWTFVIFPSVRNKVLIGFIGLGVNSGAYVAEIVRGGLMSVDIGQSEASRSLGMNYLDTMRFIVVPQAFKNILPSLGNEFITLFKDTSLVQAIGGTELLYYASTIGGRTFDYMPPLIGIAVMYLVVVIVLTWLQSKLERRLRQSDRR